jgi:hypothetical protein
MRRVDELQLKHKPHSGQDCCPFEGCRMRGKDDQTLGMRHFGLIE